MNCTILGIETSCDDTSIALYKNSKILANITASQDIHKNYGGVFPEKASRAHQIHIIPVLDACLKKANCDLESIDAIAFTQGPGLIGSLMVGCSFAKSLAFALDIPLIPVHHMQAHILAHFIEEPMPDFPFICLTVSGGHTQLIFVEDYLKMTVIGQTKDDAAGEAFDKTAKMLGLPYPGGPVIDKLAQSGNPKAFSLPLPKKDIHNFSFSGLKTAILYFLRDNEKINSNFKNENINDICASVQGTIVTYLLRELKDAVEEYKVQSVAIAGGVSANSYLRQELLKFGLENKIKTYIPAFEYCTDNGAMIAQAGAFLFAEKMFLDYKISPDPRLPFPEI
ncbi:MAG: tRNA (adenosine(37)-N6)-threonylcarbamoyltransferase complex transferase subunit TsaD [Chitinophagaceae bacterium]|nr:MAG: tRNA (adenosine(37)-N6)-threonylcarbamoyltransferase complex transferase subunit TsaD [Chitinophagaceae bacterium]